jgi:hypothetical protein
MAGGIVYVLINKAMPGYVKVGKTDSIETSVARPGLDERVIVSWRDAQTRRPGLPRL